MRAPIRRRNLPLSNTTTDASRTSVKGAKCFHCLSFSFFFFLETRLFRGLRGLTAEKFFCASVWASSTGGHASHARRPNWGFDDQPSVLLSRRHETHSTGASRNRLRFVRRNLAVAARRRAQASAITAVFPRRR